MPNITIVTITLKIRNQLISSFERLIVAKLFTIRGWDISNSALTQSTI